jgi:HK97 family phage major capsid protein
VLSAPEIGKNGSQIEGTHMSTRLFDLRKQREDHVDKADVLVSKAEAEKRSLTDEESKTVSASLLAAQKLAPEIKELENQNTLHTQFKGKIPIFDGSNPKDEKRSSVTGDAKFKFPEVGEYLKTRQPGILASLSEGGDLQFVVPGYQVQSFIAAYPNIDVFAQAGANITDLQEGWVSAHQPIIVAGADPTVYSEGTGPTSDQSATVYVAKMDTPKKHAFLSLPTEEAWSDIQALGGALTQEGVRRCMFKVGKSVTASLLTSLASAGATVNSTGDNLEDILNLIAAIPPVFAGSSNKFMMSRRSLALVRNTRTAGDVSIPIFNPSTTQILGFDVVNNDAIPAGEILFGDFFSAVYLRRAGLTFQLMLEAYKEVGAVGLRFVKRADWAFFSDAATNSQAEQPLYRLVSDLGS